MYYAKKNKGAFIKTKDGKLYITGARYEKDDNLPTC